MLAKRNLDYCTLCVHFTPRFIFILSSHSNWWKNSIDMPRAIKPFFSNEHLAEHFVTLFTRCRHLRLATRKSYQNTLNSSIDRLLSKFYFDLQILISIEFLCCYSAFHSISLIVVVQLQHILPIISSFSSSSSSRSICIYFFHSKQMYGSSTDWAKRKEKENGFLVYIFVHRDFESRFFFNASGNKNEETHRLPLKNEEKKNI